MSNKTLKIVIPMAGYGKRLRPHTWSKPKPLVSVAGKTVLDHVLDMLFALPEPENIELIFIVGYLGEQVEAHMREHYPHLKAHFVEQKERLGQSHAVGLARAHVSGPTMVLFVDTLLETDLSSLSRNKEEGIIWVYPVEDPRRFGVIELDGEGYARRLIEKPDETNNNLALVGFYYFPDGEALIGAIDEQIEKDIQVKEEYYLVEAVNLLLAGGTRMRPQHVDVWLDAGLPETVLETNHYLLDAGRDNSAEVGKQAGVTVIPPVYIDPSAKIEGATIGPHASIGRKCEVRNSRIEDSILEEEAEVSEANLRGSLVGARARVRGVSGKLILGDDCVVEG